MTTRRMPTPTPLPRELWLAGLGALATLEAEGRHAFADLVARGRAWEQGRYARLAAELRGEAAEAPRRTPGPDLEQRLAMAADALWERARTAEADLAHRLDGAVERALERADVPTRAQLRELGQSVQHLHDRLEALSSALARRDAQL